MDKFSRMLTLKFFAWINFREWPGLKNFAWIYFREDREFEKYFSLKKRKMILLSIKTFYKFTFTSSHIVHWRHFLHCLKYGETERKRVKSGKIRRNVFFYYPIPISSIAEEFLKFISRGLIFANSHFPNI